MALGSRCTGLAWVDFRSIGADESIEPSFRCFGARAPVVLNSTAEARALEETIGIVGCVGSLEFFDDEPYLSRCSGISVEVLRRTDRRPEDSQEAWMPTPLWGLWQQTQDFAARGPEAIPAVGRAVGGRIHEMGDKTVLVGKALTQQDFPERTKDRAVEICNTASRILCRVRTAVDVKSWASESEGS